MRFSNVEVVIALTIAGLINMAMVIMASGAFHAGHPDVAEIETAYHTLAPLLGIGAAGIFLLSLIASGISSSVVGTMAGQMIMQGFVGFQIPLWLRRVITMVPSFVVVALGVNATQALVISQVVLCFALPVPMAALVWFTCREEVMGAYQQPAPDDRRGQRFGDRGAGAERRSSVANVRRQSAGVASLRRWHRVALSSSCMVLPRHKRRFVTRTTSSYA